MCGVRMCVCACSCVGVVLVSFVAAAGVRVWTAKGRVKVRVGMCVRCWCVICWCGGGCAYTAELKYVNV